MQYDDDDRPAKDWVLRTDYGLDGDSLSYEDRLCCHDDGLIPKPFSCQDGEERARGGKEGKGETTHGGGTVILI